MFARIVNDPKAYDEEFEVIADLLLKRDVDLSLRRKIKQKFYGFRSQP